MLAILRICVRGAMVYESASGKDNREVWIDAPGSHDIERAESGCLPPPVSRTQERHRDARRRSLQKGIGSRQIACSVPCCAFPNFAVSPRVNIRKRR
jgi:hypothetical protein